MSEKQWWYVSQTCPICAKVFYPNQEHQIYCRHEHKVAAHNRRWYLSHREERIEQVMQQRKKKRSDIG